MAKPGSRNEKYSHGRPFQGPGGLLIEESIENLKTHIHDKMTQMFTSVKYHDKTLVKLKKESDTRE